MTHAAPTPFTPRQRAAWAAMRGLAGAAAFAIGLHRQVERHSLTDEECEEDGLPFGTTRPCIFVGILAGAAWWGLDAWDDGDGCFHIRAFGLHAEVHHLARGMANPPLAA